MKSLVIAEKPSVAADLARALGKVPKKGDVYENDEWVISSAVGHVVELEMPEDIDKKKYGFWRLETLPIIPEKFGLKPIEDSKEKFSLLKKLLARKDIDQVINACDAGREGELIFVYLYQLAKAKQPVKRAWMQSMTTDGIQKAFAKLRDGSELSGLADAARCRSESDWLIGINGTRALTKRMFGSKAGNVASVGRVQTPTLAIVYTRELEIRNFKPRAFWRLTANFEITQGTYEGVYQKPSFKKDAANDHDRADRLWEQASAEAVLALPHIPSSPTSEASYFSSLFGMYLRSMAGVEGSLVREASPSRLLYIAERLGNASLEHKMDHLVCFVPGMLALGAFTARGTPGEATGPGTTTIRRRGRSAGPTTTGAEPGVGTTTETYRAINNSGTTRVTYGFPSTTSGNPSTITYNFS
jgi:hypothetical protein